MILPNGQETKTTFWSDFSIADVFGINAIKDAYNRAFEEWKDDYVYLTELAIVLNLKVWDWYDKNDDIANVYNNLWKIADEYACEHLEREAAAYFYNMTDYLKEKK